MRHIRLTADILQKVDAVGYRRLAEWRKAERYANFSFRHGKARCAGNREREKYRPQSLGQAFEMCLLQQTAQIIHILRRQSFRVHVAWCSLGGDDFLFRSLAGQIRPTARALLCIGQRAAPSLFRADTALTGGVGAGGLDLLCGAALPVFLNLFAGKLSPLLYGEIGVLLDGGIGCIGHRPTSIIGGSIAAIPLRGGAFPQLGSAFLLDFCPYLFHRSFRFFPSVLLFGIRLAGFSLIAFMASTPDYMIKVEANIAWIE